MGKKETICASKLEPGSGHLFERMKAEIEHLHAEIKRIRAEEYTEALLLARLENDRLRASMSQWTRERDELLELRKKWEQFTEARSNIETFILENEKLRAENAKLQRVKEVAEDILLKAKLTIERVDLPIELTILEPLQDVLKDLDEEGK